MKPTAYIHIRLLALDVTGCVWSYTTYMKLITECIRVTVHFADVHDVVYKPLFKGSKIVYVVCRSYF